MKCKARIFFGAMAFAFLTACVASTQVNVLAETRAASHRELTVDCLKETGAFDHFRHSTLLRTEHVSGSVSS